MNVPWLQMAALLLLVSVLVVLGSFRKPTTKNFLMTYYPIRSTFLTSGWVELHLDSTSYLRRYIAADIIYMHVLGRYAD